MADNISLSVSDATLWDRPSPALPRPTLGPHTHIHHAAASPRHQFTMRAPKSTTHNMQPPLQPTCACQHKFHLNHHKNTQLPSTAACKAALRLHYCCNCMPRAMPHAKQARSTMPSQPMPVLARTSATGGLLRFVQQFPSPHPTFLPYWTLPTYRTPTLPIPYPPGGPPRA